MSPKKISSLFSPHSKSQKAHRIAICVPSKSSGKPTATLEELVNVTMSFMTSAFGGCTQLQSVGYYFDDAKKAAVREPITYFFSFCTSEQLTAHAGEIKRMANMLCIEFDQSEVAVEIDGTMFFYAPTLKYRQTYTERRRKYLTEGKGDVPSFFKWRMTIAAD